MALLTGVYAGIAESLSAGACDIGFAADASRLDIVFDGCVQRLVARRRLKKSGPAR
jgi:hypothetical protein